MCIRDSQHYIVSFSLFLIYGSLLASHVSQIQHRSSNGDKDKANRIICKFCQSFCSHQNDLTNDIMNSLQNIEDIVSGYYHTCMTIFPPYALSQALCKINHSPTLVITNQSGGLPPDQWFEHCLLYTSRCV